MKVITRVEPWSLGRLLGVIYAALGLIVGVFFSLFTVFGAVFARSGSFPLIFGGAAFIIMPVFYGAMGFIGGALTGAIYNVAARSIGGIKVELTDG